MTIAAVNRATLLNQLLSHCKDSTYLEIGVDAGDTFKEIRASVKHGVDPDFKFPTDDPNIVDQRSSLFKCRSDDYFSGLPKEILFDVAFIDGLHEFGQVLRDLLNVLPRLKTNGIVVIDDVLPCHYQASLPTLEAMLSYRSATGSVDMSWMGDVYKLVYFIRDYLPSCSYATSLEMHGQTILWHSPREYSDPQPAAKPLREIETIQYYETVTDRSPFNILPLEEILGRVSSRSS